MRHAQHVRADAGVGDAERAARLEQQLRRRSRTRPSASTAATCRRHFFESVTDGLPGDHRRNGRAARTPTARSSGKVRAGPMTFARFSTDDRTGQIRGYVGEGRFTDDPLDDLRRRGRRRDSATCRTLLRYICTNGFEHHVAGTMVERRRRRARSDHHVPRAGTSTGMHGHDDSMSRRRRRRLRNAERSRRRSSTANAARSASPRVAEYPVHRDRSDPDFATQSHAAHMDALVDGDARRACRRRRRRDAPSCAHRARHHRLDGDSGRRESRAARRLLPLVRSPRDRRSRARSPPSRTREACRQSRAAAACIRRSGGSPSCCTGCATIPSSANAFATALRALRHGRGGAVRCHRPDADVPRSVCAMGHKWLWSERLGGFPPEEFLVAVDPLLAGVRDKLDGEYRTSDTHRRHARRARWADAARARRRAFRFRLARSTRTGMRSAPASPKATSST